MDLECTRRIRPLDVGCTTHGFTDFVQTDVDTVNHLDPAIVPFHDISATSTGDIEERVCVDCIDLEEPSFPAIMCHLQCVQRTTGPLALSQVFDVIVVMFGSGRPSDSLIAIFGRLHRTGRH